MATFQRCRCISLSLGGNNEYDPSVRWTHLPDEEAALRYGQYLLIREFKSSGRYPYASHSRLQVKDDRGSRSSQFPSMMLLRNGH